MEQRPLPQSQSWHSPVPLGLVPFPPATQACQVPKSCGASKLCSNEKGIFGSVRAPNHPLLRAPLTMAQDWDLNADKEGTRAHHRVSWVSKL